MKSPKTQVFSSPAERSKGRESSESLIKTLVYLFAANNTRSSCGDLLITSRWLGKLHRATHDSGSARKCLESSTDNRKRGCGCLYIVQGRVCRLVQRTWVYCAVLSPRLYSLERHRCVCYLFSCQLLTLLCSTRDFRNQLRCPEGRKRQKSTPLSAKESEGVQRGGEEEKRKKKRNRLQTEGKQRQRKRAWRHALRSNVIMIKAPNNKTMGSEECERVLARSSTSLNQSRRGPLDPAAGRDLILLFVPTKRNGPSSSSSDGQLARWTREHARRVEREEVLEGASRDRIDTCMGNVPTYDSAAEAKRPS